MGRKDYTHEDAINIVRSLGNALGLKGHKDTMGISFYYVSEEVVIRISDHSAHLQTWVDYGTYVANKKYSIVIEVNPSKPNPNITEDVPQFFVKEYKHKLNSTFWKTENVGDAEILELMNGVKGAMGNGGEFSNPFSVSPKLIASVYTPPEEDVTASLKGETQPTDNNKTDINCSKNMNKKNTIRLTESDLKRVISESVKKVLKESRDESFYYDLRDEMISTRDFVFEKYSKLSKNGVITLEQLDGALQSLGGTLLNTACNLHDKLPANYGYGSPDYERIGY